MGMRPTHRLCIKKKESRTGEKTYKARTYAGVAWENDRGTFTIALNPGIIIDWRDEVWLNLYPIDADPPPPSDQDYPDDIPF